MVLQKILGTSKDKLLNETILKVSNNSDSNDQITITLTNNLQNVAQPIINYPVTNSIILGSGIYDVSITYNAEVRIMPSIYEVEDDDDVIIDFDSTFSSHQDYEGLWNLGATKYEWILKRDELSNKSTIKFYALAEHLPTESLEVKSFSNPVIQNDSGLSKKIIIDKDCDGVVEEVTVNIPISEYYQFIEPKLE